MDSILNSIKKLLGITADYTHFDEDLIIHINSVLMILTQMGVGPANGYIISNSFATWNEFIPSNQNIEAVRTYVFLKVKLIFDPPQSSAAIDAINRSISELEWRLNVEAESAQSL